jgi:AcrR family transcriptional regulator
MSNPINPTAEKKESAKVTRTKNNFASTLNELLEKKSFKKITVNDICERAGNSRSAFYLHFRDKYDLLRFSMNDELKHWGDIMGSADVHSYLVFALNSILAKRNLFYNTLVVDPDQELTDIFQELFSKFISIPIEDLQKSGEPTIDGPIPIISSFYSGGIVCSTIQWIRDGFNISIEDMAKCHEQLLAPLIPRK